MIKINLWFFKGMNIFRFKCLRTITWFSVVFDKLTLNKINVANKKWDWNYIVLRTWILICYYCFVMVFLIWIFC